VTGRDAVTAALKAIGALASGESLEASSATDGLAEMNRMLGTWSNQKLLIHAITQETPLTLTGGDSTVTMGTSGDITTRPIAIEKAVIRDGSTDYPVDILTLEQYASIPDKSTQSTYPTALYDDGGYPQRTLTLYPVPSAAKSLVLWTKRALTSIASLDTSVSLPPGYEDAIVYNLAVRLAPHYGRPLDAMIVKLADDGIACIKRANHRPMYLTVDSALRSRGGRYNINTGGYE
jgi:hypothetical protein